MALGVYSRRPGLTLAQGHGRAAGVARGLVSHRDLRKRLFEGFGRVGIGHVEGIEAAAHHEGDLVAQHVADGADFTFEIQPLAQQPCIGIGPPIREGREVERDEIEAAEVIGNQIRRLVARQDDAERTVVRHHVIGSVLPAFEAETITGPSGRSWSSATLSQGSSISSPSLMSGIEPLLERLEAGTLIGFQETLAVGANVQIGLDDGLDRVGHIIAGERGSDDLADGSVLVRIAAERDLVVFDALLIDTQNADVADVVMAAGVDTAGDLELQIADVVLAFQISEAFR